MVKLEGKVALVTGGAQGIGTEICLALLAKGVKVAFADIDVIKGEKTLKVLQDKHGAKNVIFKKCNVTDEKEFKASLLETKDTFGRLDILVNNAGVCGEDNWQKIMAVNLHAVIIGTLLGLEILTNDKGTKEGTMIINMSSVAGIQSSPICPAYVASKHGCAGWTKSWGHPANASKTGVKVNGVCPNGVKTDLLSRILIQTVNQEFAQNVSKYINNHLLKPSDVAPAFVKLLEEDVTGQLVVVCPIKGIYYSPHDEIKIGDEPILFPPPT